MTTWYVQGWTEDMYTANWPKWTGWVPGVDWFQAVENAKAIWAKVFTVYAYELTP